MALALYRKYRPATFAEVVGQEHVTVPLRTALAAGRVNHAYLFSGPRGCGKTSSARILARSLNCEQGPTDEPCGTCDSCVSLAPNGPGNVDVVELDAASHGGVDDARELRDRAFYAPAQSRYRVFIVDEAHMVTTQGFNALLKIVEEPPEHLVFIFATTEPEKVLPTIRSRTHHYPFRLIPPGAMRELLERNCAAEGAVVQPAVFPLVIRAGGGSARDTQSVLDQLLAGSGPEGVTYERAVALLGVTDSALIDRMVAALVDNDAPAVYGTVDALVEAGHDPRRFASDLLDRLRDLILLRAVPDAASRGLVSAPGEQLGAMTEQAQRLGPAALTRYAEILHAGLIDMRGATAPRLLLELLCARMLLPGAGSTDAVADAAVLHRLEQVETQLASGAPRPAAAPREQQPARRAEEPAARRAEEPPARRVEEPRREEPRAEAPPARREEEPPPTQGKAQFTRPSQRRGDGPAQRPPATEHTPAEQARPAARDHQAPANREPAAVEQPATTPDPQASSGDVDVAGLRRRWSEVVAALRPVAPTPAVPAMLAQAAVQSIDGSTVVLGVPGPLVARLSEPANTQLVAKAITSVVGGEWQVRCVPPGASPRPRRPPGPRRPRRRGPSPSRPSAATSRPRTCPRSRRSRTSRRSPRTRRNSSPRRTAPRTRRPTAARARTRRRPCSSSSPRSSARSRSTRPRTGSPWRTPTAPPPWRPRRASPPRPSRSRVSTRERRARRPRPRAGSRRCPRGGRKPGHRPQRPDGGRPAPGRPPRRRPGR
ncbi:DNA polymerase III subunit gamma and tau [Actinokineospora soli]|uniref:DNA polymerase III subunit gamma/tau n=1 Tax=Actinokineospora soli TaxID=1048753 RepID=A0ABW2TXK2_9PSEU